VKIWLDDTRDPAEALPFQGWWRGRSDLDQWVWVKTAPEAIAHLEAGVVDEVSLDHDLGKEETPGVGEGYDVLLWIENRVAFDDAYLPPVMHVHSGNQPAHERMQRAVDAIEARVARRQEGSS
jgi:hypothetical protein